MVSIAGLPASSPVPLRNLAQWVIATSLGLYFTPAMIQLLLPLWWVVLLAIAWALALGWGLGWFLHRFGLSGIEGTARMRRATSYFSGTIGGASEMTLLSEREGARSDLVAGAHSLRMLVVTVFIPLGFTWAGLHGTDATVPGMREVRWPELTVLLGVCGLGCVVLRALRWVNPWFLGALLTSMALSAAGVQLSAVPIELSSAAQLVIGISLGIRFRREFLGQAPRWLAVATLGTCLSVVVSVGFSWALTLVTGLSLGTLILGTAPGGIAEMAITAKVLQLGVPLVTAFQVCRVVAVLIIVAPLYRWLYGREISA
jgi:membrane AbrB-like protein